MTKVTRKDYFEMLKGYAEVAGDVDAVAFCEKEIERLVTKKATVSKAKLENLELAEVAYETLVALGKPSTLVEIQEANEAFVTFTNQKMSAIMKILVDTDRVDRVKEKKVTYYSIKEG